ncbi:P-loop containing nucleoside triphosphate hydrolase protein [Haematococcus lacustris]
MSQHPSDGAGSSRGSSRPNKKSRLSVGREDGYNVGTIKQVRVHDFMTYVGTVTITPGPSLNLVLGPNGSGKSSFVCALCVGLGGSTKLLGRADNLASFVRRNCNKAWTEITLSGGAGQPDIVIRRDISITYSRGEDGRPKQGYEAQFQINGVNRLVQDVLKQVRSLNIQMDNLCQFLPQDKVAEFAKMDAYELLIATEKAMGDCQMYNQHQKLIADRIAVKELQQNRQRQANTVQQLKAQQEADGREYQRYMQREKLREEAKLATIKLLWLDFKEAAEDYKVREREYKEAKDALVRCMKEEEQEAAPSQELDGREAELKRQREVARKAVVAEQTKAQRQMEEWDKARGKLEDIIDQLTRLQEKSTARARTLLQLKANITATEQQLAQQPTGISAEKLERHRQLRLEHNTAEQEARYAKERIQGVQEQVHAKQEQIRRLDICLEQLNNTRLQRLRQCESANRHRTQGLSDVVAFIEAQKLAGKFKGPVFGPVAVELVVNDMGNRSIAGYVEQQCWSGMFNFVVKYREDEELISSFIRSSRLSFTVAAVGKNESEPIHHPCGDPSQLGRFGISHTLDQVIEAPSLVKHMLADLCGINRAYIGNADTQARSDQLFNTTEVRMVYTPSVKLTFSRSHYNAQQTNNQQDGVKTNCSVLGGPSVAGLEQDKLRVQTEKAGYVTEHAALLTQMRDQETLMQAHRANADRALKGLGEIDTERKRIGEIAARLSNELGTQRRQLKSEEAKPDPLNQQEPLRKEQQAILDALVKLAGQQVQVQHKLWVKQQGLAALELALKETECQISALRHSFNECKMATERARAKCDQARIAMNEAKEEKEAAREEAEEQLPVGEVEAKLGHLPSSREELERWRQDKEAQAAELVCANAGIMHHYQRRQQDLEAKTVELAELTAREERAEADLARQDAAWRPALQGLVDTINTSFGRNFAEIGCVGEVVLTDHADYDKFAITIRVSFREGEELHALTGTRQSGGERSVSTILYLIALQAVTHTPFRVVDEINQGMDPINERKVFIQLVESSCKPGTPQCFLLTPKLLPGLPFTPEITVLTIMNGAHIDRTAVAAYNKQEGLYGARWTAAAAAQQ